MLVSFDSRNMMFLPNYHFGNITVENHEIEPEIFEIPNDFWNNLVIQCGDVCLSSVA